VYIFALLTGIYYSNDYNDAIATGVKELNDAARRTYLGALLFIILIGALLSLVGRAFALMSFNALKNWKQAQQQ
jgi:uncharacterized membrane protein